MQSIENFKTSVICLIINFLVLTELYIAFIRFILFRHTRDKFLFENVLTIRRFGKEWCPDVKY